ncbi:MAG: hypothetical protein EAZ36_06790 [Verrucomicrobia bacterium]|nr:MAG: hypothetical protein EAZ36_06790 [Verrucomicrobiota bacterium]
MRIPSLIFALIGSVLFSSGSLLAQAKTATEDAQAEVLAVKFSAARPDGGGDAWLENLVELEIRPQGKQVSGSFLNQLRVTLSLGLEAVDSEGGSALTYYQSSIEIITVESGKAAVRFYLPPEVIKRDKLRGEPKFFLVEVTAGGVSQAPVAANVSKSISTPALLSGFKGRVASGRMQTDGILMPQYFTPFANDSRRPSPTFYRREAQR